MALLFGETDIVVISGMDGGHGDFLGNISKMRWLLIAYFTSRLFWNESICKKHLVRRFVPLDLQKINETASENDYIRLWNFQF